MRINKPGKEELEKRMRYYERTLGGYVPVGGKTYHLLLDWVPVGVFFSVIALLIWIFGRISR